MINRELYAKDPSTNRLLNQGVAKVTSGQSESEIQALRYELGSFVCVTFGQQRVIKTWSVGHGEYV